MILEKITASRLAWSGVARWWTGFTASYPPIYKLNKSDRLALAEFGVIFDRDSPAQLATLAGSAGLSMADLARLTSYLNFQRSRQ